LTDADRSILLCFLEQPQGETNTILAGSTLFVPGLCVQNLLGGVIIIGDKLASLYENRTSSKT